MSIKRNWSWHGSEVVIRWYQRFFLLPASRLVFAASPLNSVAPNEKKKPLVPGYKLQRHHRPASEQDKFLSGVKSDRFVNLHATI